MKNIIYLIVVAITLVASKNQNCFSQNFSFEEQQKIDYLNAIILNPKSPDTSMAMAYLSLSDILYVSNMDTVIPLCKKSKKLAEKGLAKKSISSSTKHSLLKSLAGSLNNIGYVYMSKGDIKNALKYYNNALEIQKGISDRKGIALSLNNLGQIYNNLGEIKKALEYYDESLLIQKKIGNRIGESICLNNIGLIYKYQGDLENALNYYRHSLKIREEIKDQHGVSSSLNNIGATYFELGDLNKALKYFETSIILKKEINDSSGISYCLNNIGKIYTRIGDNDIALKYHSKSLEIRKNIGDKLGMTESLISIGKLHLKNGNNYEAGTVANQALVLAQNLEYPYCIKGAATLLSQIYEQKNIGMKALEMYKLSVFMGDSINNEATQKASIQQVAKYEYEKQKAIDDAEYNKLLAIEQEEKEKQQILTGATAGGLGLVVVFFVFVFNRLRVTKKQKLVIEEQKKEVEQQKEVVEAAHHELAGKNQEILDSITYAKRIQSAILPRDKVVKEYLQESFILYKPKDIVAGDFYWLEHRDNKVLFAAADCTGHGVPGAMVSVVCNNALNRSVREHGLTDVGAILDKTREIVIQEFEKSDQEVNDGMDIAICSLEGNKIQYAGAHNPLWIIRKGEILETKANKQPIGQFDNPEPYTTHSFELEKGDCIYIFSDGYVDQFGGEKGKKFKAKAFRSLLLSIQNNDMEEQKIIIDEAFENWKGNLEQIDDVCIIGVRI